MTTVNEQLAAALRLLAERPEVLTAAIELADARARPKATVRELFSDYEPVVRRQASGPTTLAAWRLHLLPYFGDRPAADLTWDDLDAYREMRRGQVSKWGRRPISAATRNREVAAIKAMLSWATKRKKIDESPFRDAPDESVQNARQEYPTPDQVERLIKHARPPMLGLMVRVAFECGLRNREVRILEWTQIGELQVADGGGVVGSVRVIRLRADQTKAKKARVVPLSDAAWKAIQSAPRYPDCPFIFANPGTWDAPVPKTTFGYWFRMTRKAAGLEKLGDEPFVVHSLRHAAATLASVRGMPWAMVKRIYGWSTDAVAQRYQHLGAEGYGRAAEIIGAARVSNDAREAADDACP